MAGSTVRVLMVWRHRVLGEAVAASLEGHPGVVVVGTTGVPDDARRTLAARPVDVVLLDASVDAAAALELTFRLREELPRVRILPFGVPSNEAALALVEAGAEGCIPSDAALGELVAAVVELHRGERPVPLDLAARVAARIEELSDRATPCPAATGGGGRLSDRELEVLSLVARGLSNKEIAHRLDIRTSTVKNHVHAILGKLGVRGRREAVRISYERGVLRGPLRWRTLDEG